MLVGFFYIEFSSHIQEGNRLYKADPSMGVQREKVGMAEFTGPEAPVSHPVQKEELEPRTAFYKPVHIMNPQSGF